MFLDSSSRLYAIGFSATCGNRRHVGEVCPKLPVVTRQHLILGATIAGMSISRHLDQYLSERGLVQRAEVVPEDGCQEFLPADRWFGDMPEGEMVENDTPQKYFFDESTGDVIDQARSMIEDLFRS
ncbi:hypothetical protein AY522_10600 [Corynebacterium diphtheriae bv. gravis]|uniref:Uncharacterized protein n=2 Tax=Corynebacterium diphtheriae TaxID=1717 RepID=Q6NFP0_CORDI|nr:hypothetical protein A6J36_05990 [Corynebacterium diphtheriae]MBG9228554.1 hypothetical protein [Corynebacterium diphtheriae bv. gravis]MBG9251308.1 hypothetical protein [Corynebacterium diphtheriae bv. mitis]MBG9255509.1 hypothetical protein [Corynebacterium diphtheriae bv. mitis]MBG9262272.1 hypothetical protein [Corynebacterium diphtheriae bv. mitis]